MASKALRASTLTLLGTGTCQLEADRMATSSLIELPGLRVLYDIGRGVTQRLAERGLKSDDLAHIVISHFHPDHISDLIPFLQDACWSRRAPRTKALHLYGPIGLRVQAMRLMSAFGPHDLLKPSFQVHLHEVASARFSIAGHSFSFLDFPPANNHGLKFQVDGSSYVLTGDAYFSKQLVAGLKHASLAVIDAGHPTEDEIIELAALSQCPRIICSHIYQPLNLARMQRIAKTRGYKGKLTLAKDGMKFRL